MNHTRFPYSSMAAIASGLRTTPQLPTDLLRQARIEPSQRKRSPRPACLVLNKHGNGALLTVRRMKVRAAAEAADHSVASGEYLVEGFGWGVRRMAEVEDEMRKVAAVQAEAFHVPVSFFNDAFFEFFRAEVFSALIYKIRNSPPDRYACLVAESTCESDKLPELVEGLAGVVDCTVQRDEDVLRHLHGAEEYLYVSGGRRSELCCLKLAASYHDFGAITILSSVHMKMTQPPDSCIQRQDLKLFQETHIGLLGLGENGAFS